jgi:hypothetical protein
MPSRGPRSWLLLAFALAGCGRLGYETLDAGIEQRTFVASDLDDGELDSTGFFGTGGYAPQGERNGWHYLGGYGTEESPVGNGLTVAFYRFELPEPIPAGATIEEATLRLWGTDTWVWDASRMAEQIVVEDSADAQVITSLADAPLQPAGRPLVPGEVRWPESGGLAWTLGGWNETQNLATLVQALVDRHGGLAAGAHVQLFFFRDARENGEVAAEDWIHPDDHEAELVIRRR